MTRSEDLPDDGRAAVVSMVASAGGASEDDLRAIRERVLNVVGHELRTPVTTLRGLADALTRVDPETAQAHVIPAIQRSAQRLERLVDDLLIANGIATALPVGATTVLDVVEVLRAAWEAVGAETPLAIEGADEGPVRATAQRETVEGAVRRVLDNAHVHGGGPPTVRLRTTDTEVLVEVDSPGPILPPDEVRLATQLLFRGHAAVTGAPGLGLGLPVARALVEHAGGWLAITGREGGGLVTTLAIPRSDR